MSRPYLSINSVSFDGSSNVVTMDILALRIRGGGAISITGLTQSTNVINLSDGYFQVSVTFSAPIDTSTASNASSTTYSPSSVKVSFSGASASVTTNVKLNLGSGLGSLLGAGGYTFSATQSAASASQTIFNNLANFTSGFTASLSGSEITLSAPWGNFYNELDCFLVLTPGAFGFTGSFANLSPTYSEFSGGTTTYNLSINAPDYFGFSEGQTFALTVGSYSPGIG
jgi:hypothetical protein